MPDAPGTPGTPGALRPDDVAVFARGHVGEADRAYARDKVAHVCERVTVPVRHGRIELTHHEDPAVARPSLAKIELDLDGHVARAHAHGSTMTEAIDLALPRLRRKVDETIHRITDARRRQERANGHGNHDEAHAWRHGDERTHRHAFFPRDPEDREVVRHKSFAVAACSPDEAVDDLETLDHDFFLFVNAETGEDNVVARVAPGVYELLEPEPTCSLGETAATISRSPVHVVALPFDEAAEALDLTDAPFVFHLDPGSGRGRVLYRRYDGHYGLIVPADEP